MATARHLRIILIGDFNSGVYAGEIWSTGMSFVIGDGGGVWAGEINQALPQFDAAIIGQTETDGGFQIDWAWRGTQVLDQGPQKTLAAHAETFWTALKGFAPTSMRFTGVRINAVDGSNKVIGGANMFDKVTPSPGTSVNQQPAQIAVSASLRTGRRGPAGRGRMFLPLSGAGITSGALTSANQTTIAQAVKAFIENVHAVGPVAAVVNPAVNTYSAVDRVQVGNLFDTQRRRRNGVVETYVTQTPVY